MKMITDKPDYVVNEEFAIGQSNWDQADHLAVGQLGMHRLFKTLALEPAGPIHPLPVAATPMLVETLEFTDPLMPDRKLSGEQLLNRRLFNDGLLVIHRGEVLHESYRNGMSTTDRHVIHSCTKSLCAMLVAIAVDEGKLDTQAAVWDYIPGFVAREEWRGVTLQHLMDMCAGIDYSEDYSDPDADYWQYARAAGYYPPKAGETAQGAKAWVLENLNLRDCEPGTKFSYNSCLSIVLGMVLEAVYQCDLAQLFETRLYQRIGAEAEAWFNTDPQGFPIVEGQLNLRLRDFARCALLMINDGRNLLGEQIVPELFCAGMTDPDALAQNIYSSEETQGMYPNAQYKNQFWVLSPERQQFTMLGIHGQFAWYDRNRNLMLAGVGSYPQQDGPLMMRALDTLWQGVAEATEYRL